MTISDKFTIEDIHNIRIANYEKTKRLLPEELIEKTNKAAERVLKIIQELRETNKKDQN